MAILDFEGGAALQAVGKYSLCPYAGISFTFRQSYKMFQDGAPNLHVKIVDPGIRNWIDTEVAKEGGMTTCEPCSHCK